MPVRTFFLAALFKRSILMPCYKVHIFSRNHKNYSIFCLNFYSTAQPDAHKVRIQEFLFPKMRKMILLCSLIRASEATKVPFSLAKSALRRSFLENDKNAHLSFKNIVDYFPTFQNFTQR